MESHLPDHKQDNNEAPYKIVNQERKILNVQKYAYFFALSLNGFQIGKGKCLYSTRDIEEGEIILIDSPIVQSPYTKSRKKWCFSL